MAPRSRVNPGTPKAVTKAAKKADELHEQVYGKAESDTDEPTEGEEAQEASNKPQSDPPQPESDSEAQEAAEDTSEPPSPAEPEPAKAEEPPAPKDDWEQKYRILQGKYNAEVPRMAQEIRNMRAELESLKQAKEKPAEAQPQKTVVTDQDVVDYGEDLIDLIRRVARGEVSSVEESLKPHLEEVKGQVQQTVERQAKNAVYATLNRDVQDWQQINRSPEFLEWLDQADPYAGDIRKNLLSDAFSKGDADRVAAFFKGYLAEKQVVSPEPRQQQPAAPAAQAPAPEQPPAQSGVSLEQLAGPAAGANGAAAPQQPQQPTVWTRDQVARFYRDVAAGVFENSPQRKAQIENSIAAAMKEGRIR